MQYTNTKDAMRSHCQQEHPETIFDETLTYEVPEERITTLNISINHKDGALHYKCSQCDDVLLANNGELGQHLRETHGLAITTGLDVDGEAETEQLHAGNLSSQLDLSSLPQGLQVQLMDSMSDKASAEQFFQELIDIQVSTIGFMNVANEIFAHLRSAGNGEFPPPRHHYYSFGNDDARLGGDIAHWSMGTRIPHLLLYWVVLWFVLLFVRVFRGARNKDGEPSVATEAAS